MWKKWLALPLTGALALTGLTACTPDRDPFFAVLMKDRKPTLLVAECARGGVDLVYVWETVGNASPAMGSLDPKWQVHSPTDGFPTNAATAVDVDAPATITLLETPPGWLVGDDSLGRFREDAEYLVGGGMIGNIGGVKFTLTQLRALPPGQVLTITGYEEQTQQSTADWAKDAKDSCP